MIPKNIKKDHVLKALENIDKFGVPKKRDSTIYSLKYKGKIYPPKYVIRLANKFANGYELESNVFGGGKETNGFLIKLGFEIEDKWGNAIMIGGLKKSPKTKSVNSKEEKIDRRQSNKASRKIRVATVLNSLYDAYDPEISSDIIKRISDKADIILFPAGYLNYNDVNKLTKKDLNAIEDDIVALLEELKSESTLCLGLDINEGINQLALAINKTGIIAKARKFYPTDRERGRIKVAKSSLDQEDNYHRIFEVKNKKFYLAVCYDSFGVKKTSLVNPGVDCILNLIHGFWPKGEGNSGESYFAKYGLAGASRQWACPVFAATTYFERKIPPNWPSGVVWDKGNMDLKKWKYEDNAIAPIEIINFDREIEKAEVRIFEF